VYAVTFPGWAHLDAIAVSALEFYTAKSYPKFNFTARNLVAMAASDSSNDDEAEKIRQLEAKVRELQDS
jgi:hypothetical protein